MNILTRRILPTASRLTPHTLLRASAIKPFHTTPQTSHPDSPDAMPDSLASQSFKGKTGGGKPLNSTSPGAPPEPKISNLSVPGKDGKEGRENMTEEQRKEVEQHNKEFERTHEKKEDGKEKVEGPGGGRKLEANEMEQGKKGNGEQGDKGKGEGTGGEERMKGPPKDGKGGYEY